MDEHEFRRRVDLLHASGYFQAYTDMARNMAAPFFWSTGEGDGASVLANGTICYVNTGTRHIGITCDHVYQQYLKDLERLSDVEAQFGSSTVRPEERLIDRSPEGEMDLAVFDVPEVFVSASRGNYHHNALRWPPELPNAGEVVLYGGFPQSLREQATGRVDSPFQFFVGRIQDVNASRIVLAPQVEHVYWPGHQGEPINRSFGGQSGGPVYRVIDADLENAEAVDRLELVGFIDRMWNAEVVFAKPAIHVSAEGRVERQQGSITEA